MAKLTKHVADTVVSECWLIQEAKFNLQMLLLSHVGIETRTGVNLQNMLCSFVCEYRSACGHRNKNRICCCSSLMQIQKQEHISTKESTV